MDAISLLVCAVLVPFISCELFLQVTPISSSSALRGPLLGPPPPVAELKRLASAASYLDKDTVSFMRDRIKSLEADLKCTKGQSDVWRNKAKMALENEDYLLSQISDASEQLLGKLPCEPPSFFGCMLYHDDGLGVYLLCFRSCPH